MLFLGFGTILGGVRISVLATGRSRWSCVGAKQRGQLTYSSDRVSKWE
jgi:hypothetical protein